jgi:hypothetical protein
MVRGQCKVFEWMENMIGKHNRCNTTHYIAYCKSSCRPIMSKYSKHNHWKPSKKRSVSQQQVTAQLKACTTHQHTQNKENITPLAITTSSVLVTRLEQEKKCKITYQTRYRKAMPWKNKNPYQKTPVKFQWCTSICNWGVLASADNSNCFCHCRAWVEVLVRM